MPFITITYPPKYPLTASEKKWLEEWNDSIRPAPCVTAGMRGWAFSARDCRDSSCDYNRQLSPKYCPLASDYCDAAEFESRVAARLAYFEDGCTPCSKPKKCPFEKLDIIDCVPCRLKYVRLAVEAEMEAESVGR